jgi:hypothetical protein
MRSASGDTRNLLDSNGVTASEQIQLVISSSPAKKDDGPISTTPSPQEETSFVPQSRSSAEVAILDNVYSQMSARQAHPQRPQGNNNATNPQPQSSGGGGIGGVSTPNASGGGSAGASSGAGPGVTNANQFLSAYLNMAGSALAPGAAPATATPTAAATMTAAQTAIHPVSALAAPTVAIAAPIHATAQNSGQHHSPPPPSHGHGHSKGTDPLYVLDMKNGETIPANTTLSTFSTWNENLLAQVSGADVLSYSWDISKAPDLTSVSGQNTINLQGPWAPFTGAARTDTITVTETPVGYPMGNQLSQTMTFLVAGTNSPRAIAS